MEKHCIACGMPLTNPEDIGGEVDQGLVCKYCIGKDKSVRSCEEIFEGGVQYFMTVIPGGDRDMAEKITRKNMTSLPYWKDKETKCLEGELATDEEFQKVLSQLQQG
jgi:hypothetical protein